MVDMVVEIMVEVINILAIATKEVKSGRLSESMSLDLPGSFLIYTISEKYLRKLVRNTDIEDSLERLDKLTQEEARMVSAEVLRVAYSVDCKVSTVDNGVKVSGDIMKVVEGEVRNARRDVQDFGNKIEGFEESVQAAQDDMKDVVNSVQIFGSDIKDISSEVRDVDDKLDQVNRS